MVRGSSLARDRILFLIIEKFWIIRKRILSPTGLEPLTIRFRAYRSTNWAITATDIIYDFTSLFICNMKSLKWISWNFYFNEKKSDWIEIFQIVQIIFPGGAQQVFQYKGKKVISNLCNGFDVGCHLLLKIHSKLPTYLPSIIRLLLLFWDIFS